MDSHQHVLGECIFTRELNDQLWATLKQFWDKNYDQYEWNLPEEMGNEGLIPRNLQRKISKENKGLNINSIILATGHHTTQACPYLPVQRCPEGLPYPLLVHQFTYIPFASIIFLGLPTGLQSPKLSVGQQWLSSP
ncbi:hypothetical protein PROFUN_14736 [Planoprotostelium fungivorum]|uniref:Uncharacterized protein n=1 Tax=Planoprotostelium fungivorum TaxID=1890364 RepID=A0A2P6MXZ0_9EUKA|nr:hypothetical protein PROFUN_14736 [Planoprotostelium fungivorum]